MSTWLLAAFALAAGATDLLTRRIPNWLTMPALAAGLLMHPWIGLQGAGLALAIALPLYFLRATGGGDVKMLAAAGAIAGPGEFLLIFVVNAVLGGIAALGLAVYKGRLKSTLFNMTRLKELDVSDPHALTIPRGAVFAAATLLAITQFHT